MTNPVKFGGVPLDVKLGFRMLVKYPGLTVVGGLAMAFAIWLGAMTFVLVSQLVAPTLPLPDGDRIVQLRNRDVAAGQVEPRALHDFAMWSEALRSVTDLGAYRDLSRNLAGPDGDGPPVNVAEITSSAFRIAPAAPLLGRVLGPADERAGAPAVVVLGYDLWRTRFTSDPGVIGRSVQLGDTYATVVGVMPEGFAFPVAHDAWTPLQSDVLHQPPRGGPPVTIFGRLASGVSLKEAQVELSLVGARAAAQEPATHGQLRPEVVSYVRSYLDLPAETSAILYSINLFAVLLLVLVCGNVALLLFARAATRESELVVRSALGASRGRIIAQLFTEALVLGTVAAGAGLAAAHFALQTWGMAFLQENLGLVPFWYDVGLAPASVLYAAGLTLLGAVIAGVLPALKVMRGLGARLREGTAGGGGMHFGGVWTAVIVTQVAATVAFPAAVWVVQRELVRIESFPAGFAAEQYLALWMEMDAAALPAGGELPGTVAAGAGGATGATGMATTAGAAGAAAADPNARFAAALETLRLRLAAEQGVRGVTFVDRLPRTGHVERNIELDDPPAAAMPATATPPQPDGQPAAAAVPLREVSTARVDASYFQVLGAPILEGRGFHAGDVAPGTRAVIVDQGFVDQVLLGRNAIGRHVRFEREQRGVTLEDDARPWYEIVGVVRELGMGAATQQGRAAGLYLPVAPGSAGAVNLIVHAGGEPLALTPRLREIATAADPALRLMYPQRLDQVSDGVLWILRLWLRVALLLTGIAIVLALAGIYAVLSFTVVRRTREIGVRVALGASPRLVVTGIFRRPLLQVGIGVAIGGTAVGGVALLASGGGFTAGQAALLLAHVTVMLGVCLLACVVPARRALALEPTVPLRTE